MTTVRNLTLINKNWNDTLEALTIKIAVLQSKLPEEQLKDLNKIAKQIYQDILAFGCKYDGEIYKEINQKLIYLNQALRELESSPPKDVKNTPAPIEKNTQEEKKSVGLLRSWSVFNCLNTYKPVALPKEKTYHFSR